MKKIFGLVIDAEKEEIRRVEIESHDTLDELIKMKLLIGCEFVDMSRNQLSWLPSCPDDDVWVDDEGALIDPRHLLRFKHTGAVFATRCLVLGHNDEGECADCSLNDMDVEVLKENIDFIHLGEGEHLEVEPPKFIPFDTFDELEAYFKK